MSDDFQVNTYTVYSQRNASIAADASGRFVVVWQSAAADNGDDNSLSIQGQLFDADGMPEGPQFLVNTHTTGDQENPDVAMAPSGRFVVVWQGDASADPLTTDIQGQLFASDGGRLGEEFQVNTYTTDQQERPVVAMNGEENFVVAWKSGASSSGDVSSIQGQRFASIGSRLGEQFQVNSYTTSDLSRPTLGMASSNAFVVVWESDVFPGDEDGALIGRRFDDQGEAKGPDFLVNAFTTDGQFRPRLAMAEQGDFIVAWSSRGYQGSDYITPGVQAQRFGSDGEAIGEPLRVNTNTLWIQRRPRVAIGSLGNFVITWSSLGSDGNDDDLYSVQARVFRQDGQAATEPFQVNTYTEYGQSSARVAADGSGRFVVAWRSYDSAGDDNSQSSVQGRRYCGPICGYVFGDGFETGDVDRWSQAAGTIP